MLWSALPVLLEVVPAAVGLAVGIQAASQPAYIAGFTFTGVYWLVLSFVVVGLVTVFIPPLRRSFPAAPARSERSWAAPSVRGGTTSSS